MTQISTNYEHPSVPNVSQSLEKPQIQRTTPANNKITVDEFWRREKRKNTGLIEKLYDKIKNVTGLGVL